MSQIGHKLGLSIRLKTNEVSSVSALQCAPEEARDAVRERNTETIASRVECKTRCERRDCGRRIRIESRVESSRDESRQRQRQRQKRRRDWNTEAWALSDRVCALAMKGRRVEPRRSTHRRVDGQHVWRFQWRAAQEMRRSWERREKKEKEKEREREGGEERRWRGERWRKRGQSRGLLHRAIARRGSTLNPGMLQYFEYVYEFRGESLSKNTATCTHFDSLLESWNAQRRVEFECDSRDEQLLI